MRLANVTTVRVITRGVILVCLALSSSVYGFDTRFASGKSALAIPFELDDNHIDNHIFLRVIVNDSPPLSFVLDTGASHTILSLRHAKSFGMVLQPLGKAEDATGAEPPDAYLVINKVSLNLRGVVLYDQTLVAISLDKTQECIGEDSGRDQNVPSGQRVKKGARRVVDGILGADFFRNFVVEIDYAARLINLYDPNSYQYTGNGKILALEMDPKYIFVRAQVKARARPPVTARLIVDTGSGSDLTLTKQFTEAHKLLPPAEKLMAFTDCGAGGSTKERALAGALEVLQLGGFKLPDPMTVFYQEPVIKGSDGLLGNSVLRNFKAIFDYSRSRMILERPRRLNRGK